MLAMIERKVRETPNRGFSRGIHARFVALDEVWGIKLYKQEWVRDKSYNLQERASALGLAPCVMDKFELTKSIYMYGYLTEIARPIKDEILDRFGYKGNRDRLPYEVEESEGLEKLINEVEDSKPHVELMRQLRKHYFDISDMHWGNVGRLSSGDLVAIDFVGWTG